MNNLLPGFIDSLPESEAFRSRIPMGRYGTVEEIAETAAFLLSPGSGYTHGPEPAGRRGHNAVGVSEVGISGTIWKHRKKFEMPGAIGRTGSRMNRMLEEPGAK